MGPAAPLSITVSDLRDPLAIGNETTYEVLVSNPNSVADHNIQLIATLSPQMAASTVGSSGPSSYSLQGQSVRFNAVTDLAAGSTLMYRIQAHGVQAGTGTLHAEVSSRRCRRPSPPTRRQPFLPIPSGEGGKKPRANC